MIAVAGKCDSRLQAENPGGITALEGKVGNLLRAESMAHAGVLSVNQRSRPANFHCYGAACDLHIHVQGGGSSHLEYYPTLPHGAETWGGHGNVIGRGRQLQKLVASLAVACGPAGESCAGVGDGNR